MICMWLHVCCIHVASGKIGGNKSYKCLQMFENLVNVAAAMISSVLVGTDEQNLNCASGEWCSTGCSLKEAASHLTFLN